jgi:SARP family transcriptional regulator, regulator of embCAB operon
VVISGSFLAHEVPAVYAGCRHGIRPARRRAAHATAAAFAWPATVKLVNADEVVSRDRLIEELWAGEPPASTSQSLDAYLSRLRRVFREAGVDDALVPWAPGYVLRAVHTDAGRFESLVGEGRAALAMSHADRGAELLREALALWRGSA